MNRLADRTNSNRRSAGKTTRSLWTGGLALIAVVVVIAQLNGSIERSGYIKIGVGLAVLLLLVRQIRRRSQAKGPRAAEPDPRSRLHLD